MAWHAFLPASASIVPYRHGGRDENPPSWGQKAPVLSTCEGGQRHTFQKQDNRVDLASAPQCQRSPKPRLSRHDDQRSFDCPVDTSELLRSRGYQHGLDGDHGIMPLEYLNTGLPISNPSGQRSDLDERLPTLPSPDGNLRA